MPQSSFTRAQIYAIRDLASQGVSAPRIIQTLGLDCGLETVRRVIRGETHREIGVGGGERPIASNRLQDPPRRAGDPAPAYAPPIPPDLDEQLARLDALAPREEVDPLTILEKHRGASPQVMAQAMLQEIATGEPLAGVPPNPLDE